MGALAFVFCACGGDIEKEVCNNGADEDEDGLVDCADGDCAGFSYCQPQICGDGKVEGGEVCDGLQLGGKDCAALGFEGGKLACKVDCTWDVSSCAKSSIWVCGDGVRNMDEACDGSVPAGEDCKSMGFVDGKLGCKSDCTIDSSKCIGPEVCGNGLDDDKDGAIDCSDMNCMAEMSCISVNEVACDDFSDNDKDGLFDCEDPDDCQTLSMCAPGAGAVGAACSTAHDCASASNAPVCLSEAQFGWTGGACSAFCDLNMSGSCPGDALCAPAGGQLQWYAKGLCVDGCASDADCRPAYSCALVAGEITGQLGCLPIAEVCTGGFDEDLDGAVDCLDPGCEFDVACTEFCNNNVDDDGDGHVDCEDKACANTGACIEICDNGGDDNGNGLTDCEEIICKDLAACAVCGDGYVSGGEQCDPPDGMGCGDDCTLREIDCRDLWDNDGDGSTDCMDSSNCQAAGLCVPGNGPLGSPCAENTDCSADKNDPFCFAAPYFPEWTGGYCSEYCDPAVNDCPGDGQCAPIFAGDIQGLCVDGCMSDADCRVGYGCSFVYNGLACVPKVEDCFNGIDDNDNGLVDCQDPVCPPCEICGNGLDDNSDGMIDCEDSLVCAQSDPLCPNAALCAGAIALSDGLPYSGDTTGGSTVFAGQCTGRNLMPERIFSFVPGQVGQYGELRIVLQSASDQGIYVRTDCNSIATELGCVDSYVGGTDEILSLPVDGGIPLTIFVDGWPYDPKAAGPFTLTASFIVPVCGDGIVSIGEQCDPPDGVYCDANCQIIQESQCQNLSDDDGDGLVDCEDPEDCQLLGECVPGAGPTGSACTVNNDCSANALDPVCINAAEFPTWADGYCSEFCDVMMGDCQPGAVCLDVGVSLIGNGLCFDMCSTDLDCRSGYQCIDPGSGQMICFPL